MFRPSTGAAKIEERGRSVKKMGMDDGEKKQGRESSCSGVRLLPSPCMLLNRSSQTLIDRGDGNPSKTVGDRLTAA